MCTLQTKSAAALVRVSFPTVFLNSVENESLPVCFECIWSFLGQAAGWPLSMPDCRGSRVSQFRQVSEGKINIS